MSFLSSSPPPSLLDEFADLMSSGVRRHYRANSLIIKEGDAGDAMYVLLTGTVRTYSQAANGKAITYNTIEAGHYFGELALDGGRRTASVQAVTDCECLLIPNAQVLAYMGMHAKFALHMLKTVIHRARLATEAAKQMALADVYERLWKVLDQAFEANQGVCTLTHLDMANQIGASREMVSKLMKDLERGGYVFARKRQRIQKLKKIPIRW